MEVTITRARALAAAAFVAATLAPANAGPEPHIGPRLFMADLGRSQVLELPLINGLPSGQPVVLHLKYPHWLWFAAGPDGTVYAGRYESGTFRYFVDKYAPNASGNASPIQTIRIPIAISSLWVDPSGNLYIGGLFGNGIDVYVYPAKRRGLFEAIRAPGNTGWPQSMATDAAGDLYIATWATGRHPIYVYADPTGHAKLLRQFCGPRRSFWIAVDGNDLIESSTPIEPFHYPKSFSVLNVLDDTCPATPLRHIAPLGVMVSSTGTVATFGRFLYAALRDSGGHGHVYVFRESQGRQAPLAEVDPALAVSEPRVTIVP